MVVFPMSTKWTFQMSGDLDSIVIIIIFQTFVSFLGKTTNVNMKYFHFPFGGGIFYPLLPNLPTLRFNIFHFWVQRVKGPTKQPKNWTLVVTLSGLRRFHTIFVTLSLFFMEKSAQYVCVKGNAWTTRKIETFHCVSVIHIQTKPDTYEQVHKSGNRP